MNSTISRRHSLGATTATALRRGVVGRLLCLPCLLLTTIAGLPLSAKGAESRKGFVTAATRPRIRSRRAKSRWASAQNEYGDAIMQETDNVASPKTDNVAQVSPKWMNRLAWSLRICGVLVLLVSLPRLMHEGRVRYLGITGHHDPALLPISAAAVGIPTAQA
jgi:hypothetical protein